MVVYYAWAAYVLVQLWTWFVHPLGVPEIGIGQACGLTVLVAFMSGRMDKDDDGSSMGEILIYALVIPLLALGLGYISHIWMTLS